MLRKLKILFIVLGLGIFILPKQMVFAQSPTECCDQKATDDCCSKEVDTSCHSENQRETSEKDCGEDCGQCNSCTVHFAMDYLSPVLYNSEVQHLFSSDPDFNYGIDFFSSTFQNIWQPPKIG